MRIELLLRSGDGAANETTVASTIEVGADDLRWPARLAETVAHRAQEGAIRLREHLTAPPALADPRFVPLADVVPIVDPT
jgi:hypothetical protein